MRPKIIQKTKPSSQKTGKVIIFDSGTLISFSMNGLLDVLKDLKGIFNGRFLITEGVKKEIIDKPLTIKRFELEALKLKQLLEEGIIELPEAIGVGQDEINRGAEEILEVSNKTFFGGGKDIEIIHFGEAESLSLSKILTKKGIDNVIAIDERTTRVLVEKPENLKKILGKKLHIQINSKNENYNFFKGYKIIRSPELAYVAYKKGLIKIRDQRLLDALLYAMKFKGAAISGDEIREILRIG